MDVNENKENSGMNISLYLRTGSLNKQFQFRFPQEKYFPKTPYNGHSLVDVLAAINAQNSYDCREKMAKANIVENYKGTQHKIYIC